MELIAAILQGMKLSEMSAKEQQIADLLVTEDHGIWVNIINQDAVFEIVRAE